MAAGFKIKGNCAIAVFDITDFMDRPVVDKTRYQPLAKFPGSTFDCTVVAETGVPVGEILSVLKRLKLKELEDARVAGVYPLSESKKTVTLRTWLLDREKTLSHEFLRAAEDQIVAALETAGYPLKQG